MGVKEFITQDGNRIRTPEPEPAAIEYTCDCHKRMGNDFWFLPAGTCLRTDGKPCNAKVPL